MVVITPNVETRFHHLIVVTTTTSNFRSIPHQTVNSVRNNILKFSTVKQSLQRPIFILYYDYFKTIMFAVDSYFRC